MGIASEDPELNRGRSRFGETARCKQSSHLHAITCSYKHNGIICVLSGAARNLFSREISHPAVNSPGGTKHGVGGGGPVNTQIYSRFSQEQPDLNAHSTAAHSTPPAFGNLLIIFPKNPFISSVTVELKGVMGKTSLCVYHP